MVSILINGKKNPREFQNMAQALSFAVNYGDCRNAEKLEMAYTVKAAAPVKPEPSSGSTGTGNPGSNPPPVPGTTGTADGKK
jgi:hypothetical protein